jgi:CMP-N-acetylneuraminic acid synthetase
MNLTIPHSPKGLMTVFLPVRGGSLRVQRKSTRPFAGIPGGLLELKLRQLAEVREIDTILLSTEDAEAVAIARRVGDSRLRIIDRDPHLSRNETTCGDLIRHAAECIAEGHILWTHVTSPFMDVQRYRLAIQTYWESFAKGYDSLMTGIPLRKYLWRKGEPLNYAPSTDDPWPRTQTLEPVHLIDSGIFIAPRTAYSGNDLDKLAHSNNRIGINPYILESNVWEAMDLDTEEEFALAESLWKIRVA